GLPIHVLVGGLNTTTTFTAAVMTRLVKAGATLTMASHAIAKTSHAKVRKAERAIVWQAPPKLTQMYLRAGLLTPIIQRDRPRHPRLALWFRQDPSRIRRAPGSAPAPQTC